jgi:hypothetical protein
LLAAAVLVVTVFFITGAANATSLRSTFQATNVIAPTTTTTELMTSPVSPVVQGTVVKLTATITPATAAGTVQFKDGTTILGNRPVTVSNGKAEGTISELAVGSHQLSAAFSPADPAAFTTSVSSVVPFTVTAPTPTGPVATNTVLSTSSPTPIVRGSSVTLIAAVTPKEAAGTVQFKDGSSNLGNPATVTNGTASETTLILNSGTRQLTAVFMPADPARFSQSVSPPLILTVIESPQTVTPAQASGQSLDGTTVSEDRGLTVLDLGGLTDGRGVTLLDGGNANNNGGLTLLDLGGLTDGRGLTLLDGGNANNNGGLTLLDLGGLTDGRGLTLLDGGNANNNGRGLTLLRSDNGGLLGDLLDALL